MIDAAHHIRKAYIDLLDGNLLLGAANVPVYDEMADDYQGDAYVIVSAQSDSNDSSKHHFVTDHTITLDVVTRFVSSARKYPSEDIAEQIMGLVTPAPAATGLVSPAGLQITAVRLLDIQSLPVEQFDTWKVVRKIIRYGHKCVQN